MIMTGTVTEGGSSIRITGEKAMGVISPHHQPHRRSGEHFCDSSQLSTCRRKQHQTKYNSLASRIQNDGVNKRKNGDSDAEEKSNKFWADAVLFKVTVQ